MSTSREPERQFKLSDYSRLASFSVHRDAVVARLGMLNARAPSTFCPYFDATYRVEFLGNPNLTAVLTTDALAGSVPEHYGLAVCEDPMRSFLLLHSALAADDRYVGVDFATTVGPGARIHPRACVAETGVAIGRGVTIEPNAVVLPGSVIGDDVTIQAGAIVGSDGFETHALGGEPHQMEHIGRAVVGDRVVIGYQTMIDRALFLEDTVIGEATKIGANSIMAHGCHIGRRCRIRPRTTVSGATVVGDDVVIGPSATISNSLTVGDGAIVIIGELVTRNVPAGMVMAGRMLVERDRFLAARRLFDSERKAPVRPA